MLPGPVQVSEGQGLCRVKSISMHALGGSWALLAHILHNFFAFFFYFDFLSILSRFRRGFGKVLGGQNGKKIRFLVFLGVCIWKPYFW